MVVLTRRPSEAITLGAPLHPDDALLIEVTLVSVRGDQVQLGIKAPEDGASAPAARFIGEQWVGA